MLSCDAYYISKLVPELTYEDVIATMGLSNGLFILNYDGKDIYMMKSRFVSSQLELLDRLNISYKRIAPEDLFEKDQNWEKLMLFLPKMLLDNLDSLNENTKQLALSMSSFLVRKIDDETVCLTGIEPDEVEYEKIVTRKQLEKISKIEVKPSMDSLIIVEILSYDGTKENINANIRQSMEHCLDDYEAIDNGELLWYGGHHGYRKLYDCIQKYDDMDETQRKVLVGTLVSGSNFFYRKEYWEALNKVTELNPKDLNEVRVAGGLWRKVVRSLINHLCLGQNMNLEELKSVLERIEETELHSFEYVKNNM